MRWNVLLCATLAALSASVSAQTAGITTVTDLWVGLQGKTRHSLTTDWCKYSDNGGATEILSISDDGDFDTYTTVMCVSLYATNSVVWPATDVHHITSSTFTDPGVGASVTSTSTITLMLI